MGLLSLLDAGSNTTSVLLLLLAMLLTTVYLLWPYTTFIRMGVPGPWPLPIVGNLHQHMKRGHHFDTDCFKKYGKVWGVYEGRSPFLMVTDTAMMKTVMLKDCYEVFTNHKLLPLSSNLTGMMTFSRNEDWKRMRTLLTPTFSGSKIKQMSPLVVRCTEPLLDTLGQHSASGTTFDAQKVFSALGLDVILSTAFSVEVDSQNNPDHPVVLNAKTMANFNLHGPLVLAATLFPVLDPILEALGVSFIPKRQTTFFKNLVRRLKKERQQGHEGRVDFMQLMVDSQLKGDSATKKDGHPEKTLSDHEMEMEAIEFILTGYDTLGKVMALLAFTLARNPDVQTRVQAEIDAALGHEADADAEAAQGLEYLDMVLCETLRVYPLLFRLDRECRRDTELGGLRVPAGVTVVVPVWVVHHDPRHWHRPLEFRPERFSKEEREKRDPTCYMPFGHGPRSCIGSRFATRIVKTVVSSALRRYTFRTCPDTPETLEFTNNLFLEPVKPILLQVVDRTVAA